MPSLADSAFIFILALLLFGPKKLPELARQLGKLMGEFRRASNEFRMQMEDELRLSEQVEQQKKIAALEAAAPVAPVIQDIPEPEHPHLPPPTTGEPGIGENHIDYEARDAFRLDAPAPLPIATSGDLNLMPPATGLPVARGASPADDGATPDSVALDPLLAAIPQTADPATSSHEAPIHG